MRRSALDPGLNPPRILHRPINRADGDTNPALCRRRPPVTQQISWGSIRPGDAAARDYWISGASAPTPTTAVDPVKKNLRGWVSRRRPGATKTVILTFRSPGGNSPGPKVCPLWDPRPRPDRPGAAVPRDPKGTTTQDL